MDILSDREGRVCLGDPCPNLERVYLVCRSVPSGSSLVDGESQSVAAGEVASDPPVGAPHTSQCQGDVEGSTTDRNHRVRSWTWGGVAVGLPNQVPLCGSRGVCTLPHPCGSHHLLHLSCYSLEGTDCNNDNNYSIGENVTAYFFF